MVTSWVHMEEPPAADFLSFFPGVVLHCLGWGGPSIGCGVVLVPSVALGGFDFWWVEFTLDLFLGCGVVLL